MGHDPDRLRRDSLWLSRLTLFLLLGTALAALLPTLAILFLRASREGMWLLLLQWSVEIWMPSLFYLYALWAVRNVFHAYGVGGGFGQALAAGCTRAGAALAAGAAASAVIAPNLLRLIEQSDAQQASSIGGAILHFDVAYLALGVTGLAFMMLGRLLRRAVDLQREAARLQRELDDFI